MAGIREPFHLNLASFVLRLRGLVSAQIGYAKLDRVLVPQLGSVHVFAGRVGSAILGLAMLDFSRHVASWSTLTCLGPASYAWHLLGMCLAFAKQTPGI